MEKRKISEDKRGVLYLFEINGTEILLSILFKGYARGGYSYNEKKTVEVIKGIVECRCINPNNPDSEMRMTLKAGDKFEIDHELAHMTLAKEDSFYMSMRKNGRKLGKIYRPYRDIVEELMKR